MTTDMMTDSQRQDLIRRIVDEVLERVRKQGIEHGPVPGPRVAIVLSATATVAAIDVVRAIADRGFTIGEVACGIRAPDALRRMAAELPGRIVTGGNARTTFAADTRAVVAPEMSVTDAAKLTLGILDDVVAHWSWIALSSGLPVFASPGEGFEEALSRPLRRVADAHRAACTRFGLQWAERDALPIALSARVASGEVAETVHVPSAERRVLVTEAMVANLAEGTRELIVPQRSVMTPLARDLARQRGIRIRRRD